MFDLRTKMIEAVQDGVISRRADAALALVAQWLREEAAEHFQFAQHVNEPGANHAFRTVVAHEFRRLADEADGIWP